MNLLDTSGSVVNSKAVIYSSAGQVAATTVASTGAITSASLAVDNSGTIGCDADTDIITLANQSMTVADDVDVNIAKTGGLQLGGSAITSTAAELNLLDTSVAGSVVNSKAVIYSSAGQVAATTVASTGAITSASLAVDNSGTIGCDADTDIITLANQSMTVADDVDVNIAKTGGLQLGGSAITSTAAELNLLDTSVAGSVVNSKAVIYSSAGQVAATTVASTGAITSASLAVDNSGTIGCDADTDIITLANQSMTVADDVDVNIAKTGGLQLGGSAITSTAAELNLLDTSVAGSVVNSKAVIYSSAGQVAATTVASTGAITSASLAVDNSGTIGCDADTDIITLANQSMTVADDVDVNIAKAGGLQLGGSTTSTAAELNLLDTSVAGSVVNSAFIVVQVK